ncbi:MAG TPA: O-antigen ligase family protein [Thiobacillus sp.]|nr:O-antigen ligase family protein [Thiobacillus sp.]
MTSLGPTKIAVVAFFLLFVFALSLPPKWASLHIAGLALVASAAFARREDWRSPAMRTYLLCTALWLIPVLLAAGLQHALGVATAPGWHVLPALVLRMLGIGLGIIVLLQRGWLTLHSATFALLCALSIHIGAGLIDFLTTPHASLAAWRELRINGLVFNPNPFGMFMALTAILSAGLLRNPSHRPLLWVLLIAALLGVWTSGSRGAILTVAAGFAVLFPPVGRARLLIFLGGAALAVLISLNVAMDANAPHSDSLRMQIISFTLEKIRQAPWLGWGIGAYEYLPGHVVNAPHNMWLDLAISSGLVALAGAIASTSLLTYRLYRCGHPAAQLALAALAASIVAGTLEYSILDSTHFRGLWVLVTAIGSYTLNEPPLRTTRN